MELWTYYGGLEPPTYSLLDFSKAVTAGLLHERTICRVLEPDTLLCTDASGCFQGDETRVVLADRSRLTGLV